MEKEIRSIMAVQRSKLFGKGNKHYFEGYAPIDLTRSTELDKNIANHSVYLPESELENNPAYKQIVTYCVLFNSDSQTIFSYKRAGGEKRLKDQWSIGIGGHVKKLNYEGAPIKCNLTENIQKEVNGMRYLQHIEPAGYINCDDSPINRDHFGLLFFGEVCDCNKIKSNSQDLVEDGFRSPLELEVMMQEHKLEEWSELAFYIMGRTKFGPLNIYKF